MSVDIIACPQITCAGIASLIPIKELKLSLTSNVSMERLSTIEAADSCVEVRGDLASTKRLVPRWRKLGKTKTVQYQDWGFNYGGVKAKKKKKKNSKKKR